VTRAPAIGIFVGGRGLRMGGVAKANLLVQGRTILERTLEACHAALRAELVDSALPQIYLVGESSAYSVPGVQRVADDPAGVGPMGGLRAFLRLLPRETPGLVLAGDLPFVTIDLIARLVREQPGAAALAPRDREDRWQPLFARYEPEQVLPEIDAALRAQRRSLQYLFERLGARARRLELSSREEAQLRDWDRPSDMTAGCPDSSE
jgi:molybdopterin-guanine dinucleotide biosynthesis protein A